MTKKTNTNPAMIPWPTDKWGYTAPFRAAFIEMMGKLNGAQDKKDLADAVMVLMNEFIEVKFKETALSNKKRINARKVEIKEEKETESKDLQLDLFDTK